MTKASLLLFLLLSTACYSQAEQKYSVFATLGVNHTLYDHAVYMRKTAIAGAGLQAFLRTKSGIKPTIELNGDLCTIPQFGPADEPLKQKTIVIPSLYIGSSLPVTNRFAMAFSLGTSVYSKQAHVGVRPAIAYYPFKSKNWVAKASFTHVFQKDTYVDFNDFGYFSLGLLFKL